MMLPPALVTAEGAASALSAGGMDSGAALTAEIVPHVTTASCWPATIGAGREHCTKLPEKVASVHATPPISTVQPAARLVPFTVTIAVVDVGAGGAATAAAAVGDAYVITAASVDEVPAPDPHDTTTVLEPGERAGAVQVMESDAVTMGDEHAAPATVTVHPVAKLVPLIAIRPPAVDKEEGATLATVGLLPATT